MKRIIILIFTAINLGAGFAQSVSQDIISSGGGFYALSNLTVTFTIGEPVTSLINNETISISQGFQQSYLTDPGQVNSTDFAEMDIKVFPNPTNNYVYISLTGDSPKSLITELFDLNGKLLVQQLPFETITTKSMDFSSYPEGIYLLKVSDMTNGQTQIFKIQKQN